MSDEQTSAARSRIARAARIAAAVTNGPQKPMQHLATVQAVLEMLRTAEVELIAGARSHGYSWADIAAVRGTSRQAERQADLRRRAEAERPAIDRWLDRAIAANRRQINQRPIPSGAERKRQKQVTGDPLGDAADGGQFPAIAG